MTFNGFQFYEESLNIEVFERFSLERDLKKALRENELELLKKFGCDEGQGYLFKQPASKTAFAELLDIGTL